MAKVFKSPANTMKNLPKIVRSSFMAAPIALLTIVGGAIGVSAQEMECESYADEDGAVAVCVDEDGNAAVSVMDEEGNQVTVSEDEEGNQYTETTEVEEEEY